MSKPIPVISVAVISSAYWVQRLIASIDYPVDNLVIYNNNGRGEVTEDLDNLVKIKHRFIKKISVVHFPANIGLVATWNLTVKCFIMAPYWFFCNDDIMFTPGFCEEMARRSEEPDVAIVHGGPGDFGDGAWDIFTIKDWAYQQLGQFDENFYPAYGEDCDILMRVTVAGVKRVLGIGRTFYHGLSTDYNAHNGGMQTKKSDPELAAKLDNCNWQNFQYLTEKWGPNWRNTDPTQIVFGNPEIPLWVTKFDLEFNRKKYLGF